MLESVKLWYLRGGESRLLILQRLYRIRAEGTMECRIRLGDERMEFKYLGTVLCNHGSVEGEVRERAMKGRQLVGALGEV